MHYIAVQALLDLLFSTIHIFFILHLSFHAIYTVSIYCIHSNITREITPQLEKLFMRVLISQPRNGLGIS